MASKEEFERFRNLSYEDFKALASDPSLSMYGKIGFPDDYRKGKEADIFMDIAAKMEWNTNEEGKVLLDIGPGCSELPQLILGLCKSNKWKVLLVDSKEMLDQLPDEDNVQKFEGYFPNDVMALVKDHSGKVDYIVAYSIFHYVFYNTCIFKFIDTALSMLRPGGRLFIGDIPNISKRKRFFSTETGKRFHRNFTGTETDPDIKHLQLEPTHIDDGVIMGIIQRYRGSGYEVYLLPQNARLPMHNRREDILICKT